MITRFAPSPTGPFHLGHAFSAFTVWQHALDMNGTTLLRIEDTDSTRARPIFEQGIYDDLKWLGLNWPRPVLRQSDNYDSYWRVLDDLNQRGLVYPCSCNRRAIQNADAMRGLDGFVYPGMCRHREMDDIQSGDAIRLNLERAFEVIGNELSYVETGLGRKVPQIFTAADIMRDLGDPVLRRKETSDPAYHLACVHDDAFQKVTHVIRGSDVKGLTPIHVVLQKLMGYPTPIYFHHDLIKDHDGKRLAKIDHSKALSKYRAEGVSPNDIKRLVGLPAG